MLSVIERWYPPELADDWDQVGLIVGEVDSQITGLLLTVDITDLVLAEAAEEKANLVISHHPLELTEVPGVITQTHIGRMMLEALKQDLTLYCAHTNADNALDGVSDAIMNAIGATSIGSISNPNSMIGSGRYGQLKVPASLGEFANRVNTVLPKNHSGIKIAGDVHREVKKVAVCGGSGAGLLPQVSLLDVDVYLTADIKHHAALDHQANSDIALINVSHWASEWLWLALLEKKLNQEFPLLPITVSRVCTDPWQNAIASESKL